MHLPYHHQGMVSEGKIVHYLLSSTHRAGKSKAAFFAARGFRTKHWTQLAEALRHHAGAHPVTQQEETPFGTRFVIDGPLAAPDGQLLQIRSVWFI